jgi:fructose-1,6-bisphosphatase/inositol monophosphatase family enzyme
MVTGKCAISVFVQGWRKMIASRSQNTRENTNTFARHLADIVDRTGVTAMIVRALSAAFPDDAILGEEGGGQAGRRAAPGM